jgi:hypothetical protein
VGQAAGVPDLGEYVDYGRGREAVRDPDRETLPRAGSAGSISNSTADATIPNGPIKPAFP